MGEMEKLCRNCGARVGGEYCSACGQHEGRADRRFLDLAEDLTGDVFDLDSRFWRTLFALLFRPGYLSAEFIAGRRARYLPPLRLYLVISFILFMAINIATSSPFAEQGSVPVQVSADGLVIGADPGEVDDRVEEAKKSLEEQGIAGSEDWEGEIDLADENSPQWLQDIDQRMEDNIQRLRKDPRALSESILDYAPQMMFLLMPMFALLIQLAYLMSPFHYLQHLVFALHYHSFVYLLYMVTMLLEFASRSMEGWAFLALVVYLPLALRRAYGSGWRGALFKSLFICVTYAVMLVVGFAAMVLLALVLL